MSDILTAVRAMILDSTDVTAITSDVFSDHLPQTQTPPAVVCWIVSTDLENPLDGPLQMDGCRVQVDSYGRTRSESTKLWAEVRKAFTSAGYKTWDGIDVKEVSEVSGLLTQEDRAESGTDQYRYIASSDYRVFYHFACMEN